MLDIWLFIKSYGGLAIAIGGGLATFFAALRGSIHSNHDEKEEMTSAAVEARLVLFRNEVYAEINRRVMEVQADCNQLQEDIRELWREVRRRHGSN